MAVLNDIRALFAQCPALKDLEARTDKLETDAEGYSILPTGSAIIAQDTAWKMPATTSLSRSGTQHRWMPCAACWVLP